MRNSFQVPKNFQTYPIDLTTKPKITSTIKNGLEQTKLEEFNLHFINTEVTENRDLMLFSYPLQISLFITNEEYLETITIKDYISFSELMIAIDPRLLLAIHLIIIKKPTHY
ncbi:hypothetical protein [Mesonia mobilis]|uniref:hypothetical protein n=1 Tax=Mesonia mobilis TaxID=369791 RepID=UPI0024BA2E30|nr:hypothetical protein [Mesonia mobilis]